MLYFLISFILFILFLSNSQNSQSSTSLCREFLSLVFRLFEASTLIVFANCSTTVSKMSSSLSQKKRCTHSVDEITYESTELSVIDLPELALERILSKLPPAALSNMAAVCSSLRERCRSDYLWENHMSEKWGKLIGPGARREWQLYLASGKDGLNGIAEFGRQRKWFDSLACMWPISWIKSKTEKDSKLLNYVPDDSIMSWYQSLESGKFWFPAQVYNREHGHVGFLLSCYDAEVSYDCKTDTFKARYPPHGQRAVVVEEGVTWERIRAPSVDTPAYELHISECLNELCPGDHIEIQWRRNKAFPYGWWYGVVGHLDSCDGNQRFCRCRLSDTIFLEFAQYAPGSRWRRAKINRKDHREEGSEADGFYGGIRRLRNTDEISTWRKHWPNDVLE